MLNFSFGHNFLKLYKYHKMGMNKQIRCGLGVKEAGWTGHDFNISLLTHVSINMKF
jgi:hypothetical protein